MEYIHNTKKRMPLILSREEERRWLDPELTKAEIKELMQPLDDGQMRAEVTARLSSHTQNPINPLNNRP